MKKQNVGEWGTRTRTETTQAEMSRQSSGHFYVWCFVEGRQIVLLVKKSMQRYIKKSKMKQKEKEKEKEKRNKSKWEVRAVQLIVPHAQVDDDRRGKNGNEPSKQNTTQERRESNKTNDSGRRFFSSSPSHSRVIAKECSLAS